MDGSTRVAELESEIAQLAQQLDEARAEVVRLQLAFDAQARRLEAAASVAEGLRLLRAAA